MYACMPHPNEVKSKVVSSDKEKSSRYCGISIEIKLNQMTNYNVGQVNKRSSVVPTFSIESPDNESGSI